MRKTRIAAVAAMAAAAALTLTACGGGPVATAPPATPSRSASSSTSRALGFKDGDEYTGFDVDVAKYVANELGFPADKIELISDPVGEPRNRCCRTSRST